MILLCILIYVTIGNGVYYERNMEEIDTKQIDWGNFLFDTLLWPIILIFKVGCLIGRM